MKKDQMELFMNILKIITTLQKYYRKDSLYTGLGIRSNQISNCEQFVQIAQDKWATVSKSLRSLRGNERSWAKNERPWVIRSSRSEEMSKWAILRSKMLAKKI